MSEADDSNSSEPQGVDVEETGTDAVDASGADADAKADAGEAADASDDAEADPNAVPDDTAAAYKIALDSYLNGDLKRSLEIVDAVLERDPETELKPRLQRLRRRAEDRIVKEGGDLAETDASSSDEAEASSSDEGQVEATSSDEGQVEAASSDEGQVEATSSDEGQVEATSSDEGQVEATSSDEGQAEPEAASESGEAAALRTDPSTPVDGSSEERALEEKKDSDGKTAEAPKPELTKTASGRTVAVPEGRVVQKRTQPSSGSQARKPGQAPVKPRPRPGGVQRRVSGKPAPSTAAVIKPQLDQLKNSVNKLANSFRVVEGSVVKVAEAYQKIARTHKRKEQAYDQLYEELRGYKENFLLAAQKPLFKDIVLLFDAIRRVLRNVEEAEGDQLPREMVEDGLKHIRDEVLELLYRRDIELIEEYPDKLNIDFQKPVKRIDVDDPAEDRDIVEIVREGFRMNGATMRPQEVVVKRCVKESEN